MVGTDGYAYRRRQMVEGLERAGIRDSRVLDAMGVVPRHIFVPQRWRNRSYDESALAIGQGQTISQPYVVARMTEVARLRPDDKVLEIGTGSGYQASVLSHLVRFVFTVERIPELAREAKARLDSLGIENVSVKVMDGSLGWSAQAPYNAILVTAGAPEVPRPLLSQLAEGGRMVVPVGEYEEQDLMVVERRGDSFVTRDLGRATFVPLIGRFGWRNGGGEA
jgi:protein-L-isoaspartate(D-aspartate) O-methyltransferase